jgi:hypothetical protein
MNKNKGNRIRDIPGLVIKDKKTGKSKFNERLINKIITNTKKQKKSKNVAPFALGLIGGGILYDLLHDR